MFVRRSFPLVFAAVVAKELLREFFERIVVTLEYFILFAVSLEHVLYLL